MNVIFAGKNSLDFLEGQKVFEMKQVHGDRILFLDSPEKFDALYRAEADAVICTVPNLTIAVRTADCVPILISHPQSIVAAVHAGWRGTELKILQKTLREIKEKFNINLSEVKVAIGPSICEKCYEVSLDVAEKFLKDQPLIVEQINSKKYLLNLKAANQMQAEECGVPLENIDIHLECTLCNEDEFYSYRASSKRGEASEGRNYSLISI